MMMNDLPASRLLRGELKRDEPLARYTTWRCGGPAQTLYKPRNRADLATFIGQLPAEEPVTVIGLGSNLLVRDGGVRGTVIVLHPALGALEVRDGLVYAEAGVASPKVARFAAMHGLADAEFLAGSDSHFDRHAVERGARRHRAAQHDDVEFILHRQRLADGTARLPHIGQIATAIRRGRRADRQERHVGRQHGGHEVLRGIDADIGHRLVRRL